MPFFFFIFEENPEEIPFGKRLKYLLEDLGMNIRDLSEASGVNYSTVHKIVTRENDTCSLPVLKKLAKGLNMSIDELADYDPLGKYAASSMETFVSDVDDNNYAVKLKESKEEFFNNIEELIKNSDGNKSAQIRLIAFLRAVTESLKERKADPDEVIRAMILEKERKAKKAAGKAAAENGDTGGTN